jgi:hypothetical protein
MNPNLTITRMNAVWHWKVDADDAVYSGVCATRWEAEAEGGRVAWDARSTVPWVDPTSGLRADLAIAIARAEAAEAALAECEAALANTRQMHSTERRCRLDAEAALATARAEGAAAERAAILDVIRERAAGRTAQAAVCAEAGGNADVVYAKASECGALAAIIDGTATMPRWPGRPVEGA